MVRSANKLMVRSARYHLPFSLPRLVLPFLLMRDILKLAQISRSSLELAPTFIAWRTEGWGSFLISGRGSSQVLQQRRTETWLSKQMGEKWTREDVWLRCVLIARSAMRTITRWRSRNACFTADLDWVFPELLLCYIEGTIWCSPFLYRRSVPDYSTLAAKVVGRRWEIWE